MKIKRYNTDHVADMVQEFGALIREMRSMGIADMPGETFADLRNRVDSAAEALRAFNDLNNEK